MPSQSQRPGESTHIASDRSFTIQLYPEKSETTHSRRLVVPSQEVFPCAPYPQHARNTTHYGGARIGPVAAVHHVQGLMGRFVTLLGMLANHGVVYSIDYELGEQRQGRHNLH